MVWFLVGLSKKLPLIDCLNLLVNLWLLWPSGALSMPAPIRTASVVVLVDHDDEGVVAIVI